MEQLSCRLVELVRVAAHNPPEYDAVDAVELGRFVVGGVETNRLRHR